MSKAIPTPPPPLPARIYPLPAAEGDPRFDYGLLADVAKVLIEHSYPRPGPLDMVALLAALHGFLYVREDR